jgi:hypothetical protein
MAWYLVKNRDNFTPTLIPGSYILSSVIICLSYFRLLWCSRLYLIVLKCIILQEFLFERPCFPNNFSLSCKYYSVFYFACNRRPIQGLHYLVITFSAFKFILTNSFFVYTLKRWMSNHATVIKCKIVPVL